MLNPLCSSLRSQVEDDRDENVTKLLEKHTEEEEKLKADAEKERLEAEQEIERLMSELDEVKSNFEAEKKLREEVQQKVGNLTTELSDLKKSATDRELELQREIDDLIEDATKKVRRNEGQYQYFHPRSSSSTIFDRF